MQATLNIELFIYIIFYWNIKYNKIKIQRMHSIFVDVAI